MAVPRPHTYERLKNIFKQSSKQKSWKKRPTYYEDGNCDCDYYGLRAPPLTCCDLVPLFISILMREDFCTYAYEGAPPLGQGRGAARKFRPEELVLLACILPVPFSTFSEDARGQPCIEKVADWLLHAFWGFSWINTLAKSQHRLVFIHGIPPFPYTKFPFHRCFLTFSRPKFNSSQWWYPVFRRKPVFFFLKSPHY